MDEAEHETDELGLKLPRALLKLDYIQVVEAADSLPRLLGEFRGDDRGHDCTKCR